MNYDNDIFEEEEQEECRKNDSFVDDEEEGIDEKKIEEDSKNNILDLLTNNNKNMYFDEEHIKDLIVNKYQPFLKYEINEKGKRVCTNRENAPKDVEKEIMANLLLIANAIIFKYRFWRFDTIDELRAEALLAMWKYIPNFVPNKGTSFDLFSIICKHHLLNFTYKNYKHRLTTDVDVCFDVSAREDFKYDLFFEDLEKTFLEIINKHYLREQRKKYIELTSILMEYLDKNKKIVGKNDLFQAFKAYSYKSTEYKKFIEEMSKYKEEFYKLAS